MAAWPWPVVALIFGIIFLLIFKKPLSRLIDRTEKIGKKGVKARKSARDAQKETPLQQSQANELLRQFDNVLLTETEEIIRKGMEDVPTADRERVFIRYVAGLWILQWFERAYAYIFGSQIATLQELNSKSTIDTSIIKLWYDQAAAQAPDVYEKYSFQQWLSFLEAWNLITQTDEQNLSITVAGREFLKFLINQGYSLYKPL